MSQQKVTWNDLNCRQQAYLRAVYDEDQQAEALERRRWSRSGRSRKADTWRWMGMIQVSGDRKLGRSGPHLLKSNRADIPQCGVPTRSVVPDFDELEDGVAGVSA
jgi:hypothetical protein